MEINESLLLQMKDQTEEKLLEKFNKEVQKQENR